MTVPRFLALVPRGWRRLPLAFQILGLLIGGLVVAQLVTLFLTMVLPPAPPPQYGLGDIAAVLRGARKSGAGTLERTEQAAPPDLSGPGWLVSERSRRELAGLLGVDVEAVNLAFYTPLPFAGSAMPPPPRGMADDGPLTYLTPGGRIDAPRFVPAVLTGGQPAAHILARIEDMPSAKPPMPLPLRTGVDGFGSLPRDGVPPGPSPDRPHARVPGVRATPPTEGGATPRGGLYAIDPRPLPSVTIPGDGGVAVPPLLGGAGPQVPPAAALPPVSLGRPRVGESPFGGLPDSMTRLPPIDAPGLAPSPWRTAPRRPFDAPSATASPGVPERPNEGPPQPSASIAPPAAVPQAEVAVPPTPMPMLVPVPAVPADAPHGPAIAVNPPARGLFGLAPAPFVEGDFVAALRVGEGRWVVVQPAPDPFPNAWQRRLLLWFVVAFAIVAPLGWLFARRLVTPLGRFAAAAERLGRDPAAAAETLDGPGEIGRAARAFNLMQGRLRSFVDDRTAMVGAISHDLRTPLTRLRFRIEDVPDDQREGMLEEVAEMEAMISSVLAFVRDAATPNLRDRLDLATLVGDVVENAVMVGWRVTITRVESAPVEVDVLGMRRVLDNLVGNAAKYGVRARVGLRREGGAAVVSVLDDGPGLPDGELEQVFEPFYRGASARASDHGGSGLGLAVCRSIARAHGGDVRLIRTAEGFVAELRVPLTYGLVRPPTA